METKPYMKVLGRRTMPTGGIKAAKNLQETLRHIRGNRPFVPRGVYRFQSFEEADTWLMKMLTR